MDRQLLLPAPMQRRCYLCDMPLYALGRPYQRCGFVVVMATGRAFCSGCMNNHMPARLNVASLEYLRNELEAGVDEVRSFLEAARFVPLRSLREQIATLALDLAVAVETVETDSIQSCGVCGCWQTDDGEWHGYLHGDKWTVPKRARAWLTDDLCSACLGQYTPENTLAGQCDTCQSYTTKLAVRAMSQYATCPECTSPVRRVGKEGF